MDISLIENYLKEAVSWIDIIEANSLSKQQAKLMISKALDLLKEPETKPEIETETESKNSADVSTILEKMGN